MNNINNIYQYENKEQILNESLNSFQQVEDIIEDLMQNNELENADVDKIAKDYKITKNEAKCCLRLAFKQSSSEKYENLDSKNRYANSGYFYPTSQVAKDYNTNTSKNDGMDTLSAYSNYNKIMFGIK